MKTVQEGGTLESVNLLIPWNKLEIKKEKALYGRGAKKGCNTKMVAEIGDLGKPKEKSRQVTL